MKKIIALVICLLIATSAFAFDQGTKIVWGEADFSSYKYDKDADPVSLIELNTLVGYFLMKDISLNIILGWYNVSTKSSCGDYTYKYSYNDILIGLGGSFFIKNIYAAAAFMYNLTSDKEEVTKSDETTKVNATYLDFGVGYLVPIIENVYLDIGLDYMMGLGEYSGDDGEGDNTESNFSIGAGIVVAIP